MIPFEPGRGPDPHRRHGERGGAGDPRDFGPPDGEGFDDWGGRLGRPQEEDVLSMGQLRDFPERSEPARAREPRAAWLVAPLMLVAAAAGVVFVLRGPDHVFGLVFEVVLALGVLWILVSALFPAKADRTCPDCGRAGLERLDRETTEGLVCTLCGWRDTSASGFLLAEDEGPIEDIVLRERGRGEFRP